MSQDSERKFDDRRPSPATDERSKGQQPPEEVIRNRAYELYERRGAEQGRDLDDWLEAEREVQSGGREPRPAGRPSGPQSDR